MSEYFNQGQRQLQETFETVPLADRLHAGIIAPEMNPLDAEFIEAQNMFFLATVDDKGQANCSYKGGQKGLVKVVDQLFHCTAFKTDAGVAWQTQHLPPKNTVRFIKLDAGCVALEVHAAHTLTPMAVSHSLISRT